MIHTAALSIGSLNDLIRDWIEACPLMQDIWVNGEIKNFRRYASGGHIYFTLSDSTSTIPCVAFDSAAARLKLPFRDGMQVMARGKVRYFNRKGSIQFQIAYMMPQGAGDLALNLALLKEKLTADGIFDLDKKRNLPPYPQHIAVITAHSSAAEADVIRLLGDNAPSIRVTLIPATMQGLGCAPSVIAALDAAHAYPGIELILITRGGGSADDLLPFNDEGMVRKIAESARPVAVAIGHDTDTTFADLAADQSFPTPSAAAIGIAKHLHALPGQLLALESDLFAVVSKMVQDHLSNITTIEVGLNQVISRKMQTIHDQLDRQMRDLELLSPLRKLRQGFSISRLKNKAIVMDVADVSPQDVLVTQVQNGVITSRVTDIHRYG